MILFGNNIDINNYFTQKTKLDFPTWFNKYQANYGSFKKINPINSSQWNVIWSKLPQIYPNNKLNLIEFLALNTILVVETNGTYLSQAEKAPDGVDSEIKYMFNNIGKNSYNTLPGNQTAYQAFNDTNFINQFQNLPLNNLSSTNDIRWCGQTFPVDLFTPSSLTVALRTSPPTFINECDFYKFRGRGLIKLLGRNNYKKIIDFIINYTGTNNILLLYKSTWSDAPFNSNLDIIATRSSNHDWDVLFESIELLIHAIKIHIESYNNYHIIPLTTDAAVEQKLKNIANKVSNNNPVYRDDFLKRIRQQVDDLKDLI